MGNDKSPSGDGRRIAIVTGSTGNLGKSVVNKFITEGYKVVGTVVPGDSAENGYLPDKFDKEPVDLLNEEDSARFVKSTIEKYGAIDAAVLTVGGFALGNIAETATADILKQYKLNFETTYNVIRPVFVQMMKQKHGRIFIIGSKPGLDARNSKGMVAYGLAKSLIFRLAEIMNDEATGHDVETSVVVPGTIDTPQNRATMPDADFSNWVKPETLAEIIYMHCTESHVMLPEPVIKVYDNS